MSEPRLTFLLGSVTLLSWKSLQKRYSSPHSRNLKGVYEVWPLTYTFSFLKEIANKMDDCPQVKSKRCLQKSKLNMSKVGLVLIESLGQYSTASISSKEFRTLLSIEPWDYLGPLRQSLNSLKLHHLAVKIAVFQASEFPFVFRIITQRWRH